MAYTMNTTLGELLKDPRAKAVIEQQMPGATSNPMLSMASGMSLNTIVSMPQAAQLGLTKEKVEALLAEINTRA